ncbi:MAG: 1-acyl-sn-glycerol-3-phosphate acyltransferase [Oscillospiraceae bacterium]|nr:1-acyl-sn-glycerol-3-phosphate acyltransferase [Oscillospiraceae bacterium]
MKFAFLSKAFMGFVRITGLIPYALCFKTKVHCANGNRALRHPKGSAIIISNHTSVFDYAVLLFTYPLRYIRCQIAELMFRKPVIGPFLRAMGGIYVNRDSFDFSFVEESLEILDNGGVLAVFPESRIPLKGEALPLPFKQSTTLIAARSRAPIFLVYTDGSYFKKKRAHVLLDGPVYVQDFWDDTKSEKENLAAVTESLRQKIAEMGQELESLKAEKKKEK